jgi:flagellar biosynthesis protein FlhF
MITKTYRAENMLVALAKVQEELGPDALVVSVRQVTEGPAWQVWRKPIVEVVAVRSENDPAKPSASLPAGPAAPKGKGVVARAYQQGSRYQEEDTQDFAGSETDQNENAQAILVELIRRAREESKRKAEQEEENSERAIFLNKRSPVPQSKKVGLVDLEDLKPASKPAAQPNPAVKPAVFPPAAAKKEPEQPAKPVEAPATFAETIAQVSAEPKTAPPVVQPVPAPAVSQETASKEPASKPQNTPAEDMPAILTRYCTQLRQQGVDEQLLTRISAVTRSALGSKAQQDDEKVCQHLKQQLAAFVRVQPETSQIVCLIGLSGSGKTSACAKLAAYNYINQGKLVVWICADTVRTGAIAEARTYADTLGIPFHLAYTPEDLLAVVESVQDQADLILVDTPACNPRSETSVVALGELLTVLPKRSTWMVAPATAKESDLQNAAAAFGPFRLRGLVLTKMDETNTFGASFNLAWRSQIPISFYTFGSNIVNDIAVAEINPLVDAMFEEKFNL